MVQDEIKIAIIMPCYYPSSIIKKAFEQIKKQTKRESIVLYMINDCSPFTNCEYQDLIQEYSLFFKIIYLKTEKNSGPGVARQLGLNNIKEKFFIFHDDDDYIYDEYVIEKYLNIIKINPDLAIIIGNNITQLDNYINYNQKDRSYFKGQLINKEVIDKYNITFNTNVSFMGEDFVFHNQLKYYCDINHLKVINIHDIVHVCCHLSNLETLTGGLLPEGFVEKKQSKESNRHLTKITFEKINIYYELINFYHSCKKLQKQHVNNVYSILKTVYDQNNLMLIILEKYGIKNDYSEENIKELFRKWKILLDLINKNKKIIKGWCYNFDNIETFGGLLKLNQKMQFDEFYNTFEQRFKNLV